MKKPNTGFYIRVINDAITESETIGETMNDSFEIIRSAIDNKKIADLKPEQLKEIHAIFSAGTDRYRVILAKLQGIKPPVKVIGIHKKLEKAYEQYVASCQEMVDSILVDKGTVDSDHFDSSENHQDEATDMIAFSVQRITSLIMK
ncbi:hypothetical protein [Vagococcus sp.]|uniref:hypothetical protein n=1 Tax=Vagococcus sp. TaxID=1933889 RepID=UPI003F981213